MSTVTDVVKALKKVGAVCRKKPREEQYVCHLKDKGEVGVVIDPYIIEVKLVTDEEVTEFYYDFAGELEDSWSVEQKIKEKLGANADTVTVQRKGGGYRETVYVLRFETDKAEPEKIARIVRNIAEKDIWVGIRYRMKIGLRKGEEWFRSKEEFIEELLE